MRHSSCTVVHTVDVSDRLPGEFPRIETERHVTTVRLTIDVQGHKRFELVVKCHSTGEILAALRHREWQKT